MGTNTTSVRVALLLAIIGLNLMALGGCIATPTPTPPHRRHRRR